MTTPLFIDAKEVCKRRSISRTTLWAGAKSGQIPPPYHFGRAARWAVEELEANERDMAAARFIGRAVA